MHKLPNRPSQAADFTWVDAARARGFAPVLLVLLDVLEPVGVLGAQVLYMAQPVVRLFGVGSNTAVEAVARALETPEEYAVLRALLAEDAPFGEDRAD